MTRHKNYTVEELVAECEKQHWQVKATTGGWMVFPRNKALSPITMQKLCRAPVELSNYRARLARSGLRLHGYEPDVEIPNPVPAERTAAMPRPRRDATVTPPLIPIPSSAPMVKVDVVTEPSFDQLLDQLKDKIEQSNKLHQEIVDLVEKAQLMYMELEAKKSEEVEEAAKLKALMRQFVK